MSDAKQYCSFHVGEMFFGVEVREVQEVIRYQKMTAVPLAPPELAGLINLRGQIVTAVDLRRRLGVPDRAANGAADGRPMNVVVRTDDGAVSLLVDEIGDVLEVDAGSYEQAPDTLDDRHRELIRGVHKLDGRLLLILNTERAIGLC